MIIYMIYNVICCTLSCYEISDLSFEIIKDERVVWHVCLPVHSHGEQTTSPLVALGNKAFHALFRQPIIYSLISVTI